MAGRESASDDSAVAVAERAGLAYVDTGADGITRRRCGRGFTYKDPTGSTVTDQAERDRILELVIPPAWEDVWICPDPSGHIQATGRDAEGRKQYIYHPDWVKVQEQRKFERMLPFGKSLPELRRHVGRHVRLSGIPWEKVAAAAVRVLDTAAIRVGNDRYAVANQSFGLTTLRHRHVQESDDGLLLEFTAKSGRETRVAIEDDVLVRVLRELDEVPGYRVFKYADEAGGRRDLTSEDVNDYLSQMSPTESSAKDFRTWAGTARAVHTLTKQKYPTNQEQRDARIRRAMEEVAELLGNTPAVARSAYVDPRILGAYSSGDFPGLERAALARADQFREPGRRKRERLVLAFLDCLTN